jgi:predicted metal-binding membrane protein
MSVLLVFGVMNLRAMAIVAAIITVERFALAGQRIVRAIGVVLIGTSLFVIARVVGLG